MDEKLFLDQIELLLFLRIYLKDNRNKKFEK